MTWEQNYLAHHGIKGQQWGIRRYQNEDGTLTEEGRQRYLESYGVDATNNYLYEQLFKQYSNPRTAASKEAAEHNKAQAVKAGNAAKYNQEMMNLISKNKKVNFSFVEKMLPSMSKKYNLDIIELMEAERSRWSEILNDKKGE